MRKVEHLVYFNILGYLRQFGMRCENDEKVFTPIQVQKGITFNIHGEKIIS